VLLLLKNTLCQDGQIAETETYVILLIEKTLPEFTLDQLKDYHHQRIADRVVFAWGVTLTM
jgi:hypothetical protein